MRPPRTHIIERLVELLPQGIDRPLVLSEAGRLTDYAAIVRYPGGPEAVTEDEYEESLRLAEAVTAWAEAFLAEQSATDADGATQA